MKKINVLYWVFTILFGGFMLFSGITGVMKDPNGIKLAQSLQYPVYFWVFLGVAKILGAIAILIPGFPRIKEWAYAGLFFDLIGATYSQLAVFGMQSGIAFMLLFFIVGGLSYYFYHKRMRTV